MRMAAWASTSLRGLRIWAGKGVPSVFADRILAVNSSCFSDSLAFQPASAVTVKRTVSLLARFSRAMVISEGVMVDSPLLVNCT
ncbi:MAG: hypothetical protein BWY83_01984 [bacterium ADurb.Bin478]|nr:MAG: hypothetical protein BWY83_01984 [bacterium ADurb.Bin478]